MEFSCSESREERKTELSYTSEDKKSSKPRYILVAAMVIVIIQGMIKICVAKVTTKLVTHTQSKKERTVLSGPDIWRRFKFNQYFSSRQENKKYHSDQGKETPAHQMRITKICMKLARLTVGTTPATVATKSQMTPLEKIEVN